MQGPVNQSRTVVSLDMLELSLGKNMSFLSEIFAGGASGLLEGASSIIKTMKADPLEIAKLEQAITQAKMNLELGLSQAQTKINEIEAASSDKFVSRWRPTIGWICGAAYAYTFIFQLFVTFILVVFGHPLEASQLPHIPVSELSVVLMGMLGLAGMRSYEKIYK